MPTIFIPPQMRDLTGGADRVTAAGGATIGVSPTPRTPYGCAGLGTSTMIVSIIGRSKAVGMR